MEGLKIRQCPIEGPLLLEPQVFCDCRGYFKELYRENDYARLGIRGRFVQENCSGSVKGVLRGLHFQKRYPQAKLLYASRGCIFDVAVDLREGSKTFGKWHGEILSEENHRQFYVPEHFAHGFLVLSDYAEIVYKCTDYYHPEDEGGIRFDDLDIQIEWPQMEEGYILSEKDKALGSLSDWKREMRRISE